MNRRQLPDWLAGQNSTEIKRSPKKSIGNNNKKYKNDNKQKILSETHSEAFNVAASTTNINDVDNIPVDSNLNKNAKSILKTINATSTTTASNIVDKNVIQLSKNCNELTEPEKLIANIKLNETNQSEKRTLRSNSKIHQQDNNNTNKETTVAKELKSSQYPFIEYKGNIKYLVDMIDIACTCDEIMKWVEIQEKNIVPLAFDMEWSFSFNTGQGKTALIQLCAEENVCYLFHVFHLKKLPAALVALLRHNKVQLHGVNIKNDLRKLQRDFSDVNVECMIEKCLDLGTWCNTVCNTGGRWSLERLVLYICKLRIDKNKNVRMSKWHVIPLNETQKTYAAIDVYISQVIYKELETRSQKKERISQELRDHFGENTLSVLRALDVDFI